MIYIRIWLDFDLDLILIRILDFGWIWLDLIWIWLDFGWIWLDLAWLHA